MSVCRNADEMQIPECQEVLPKAPGGQEPLPEGRADIQSSVGIDDTNGTQVSSGFS